MMSVMKIMVLVISAVKVRCIGDNNDNSDYDDLIGDESGNIQIDL